LAWLVKMWDILCEGVSELLKKTIIDL